MTTEADVARMTPEEARAKIADKTRLGDAFGLWFLITLASVSFAIPYFNVVFWFVTLVGGLAFLGGANRKLAVFTTLTFWGLLLGALVCWSMAVATEGIDVSQSTEDHAPLIVFGISVFIMKCMISSLEKDAKIGEALKLKAAEAEAA